MSINPDECCPKFDPAPWQNKSFEWSNKLFVKDKVCTLFYIPMNFGSVMKRINAKVCSADAETPEWLCLSEHTSKWNMNIYCEVTKEVPASEMTTLSGIFFSKVYEGNFKETSNWMKDYDKDTKVKGLEIEKTYMWYTTCPKCAKKFGHNYTVIIGKIK
jgi:hypothetical protein